MQVLAIIARSIDRVNDTTGRFMSWATLALVLVQFVVVIMRYVFGIGSVWMQESLIYMHASLFMFAAAYTLLHNGHVRVDLFYRTASPKIRAMVDLGGALLLLMPVCIFTWWTAWPYVEASWSVFEGSRETTGIQAVYLLKSVILVFAALMAMQGVSLAIHSFLALKGLESPTLEESPKL